VKVVFSPAARDDLLEIAMFIAQDNPTRALAFVDTLEDKCQALGTSPGIGTARPDLGEGVRMMPHRRYLIFCREANNGLRIERVLHGARDIGDDDFEARDIAGGT
jgi:toxin ParE1/3/4